MTAKSERNRRAAVAFLKAAATGTDVRAAGARFFAPGAKHHNLYFPAGMDALLRAMADAARKNPRTRIDVIHAVADDRLVAVHSHVRHAPRDRGFAVVHLFRFARGKVVEMWDVGAPIPARSPNADGAF